MKLHTATLIAISAVTLATLSGTQMSTAYGVELVTTDTGASEKAREYTEKTLVPDLKEMKELFTELKAANTARKDWAAYSEDYKKWTPEAAEQAKEKSYTWGEYMWSVKKDRAFRDLHMTTKAAEALKAFQTKSNGVIAECFVVDNKGGNVVQTALTSDWFQGDEDKFVKCDKKKECFYPAPKRDDTCGQTGVQVSVPLWDGEEFVGVAVVLVVTDKLGVVASAEEKK